jgi:hypothetical protein
MTNNGTLWGAAYIIKCLNGRTALEKCSRLYCAQHTSYYFIKWTKQYSNGTSQGLHNSNYACMEGRHLRRTLHRAVCVAHNRTWTSFNNGTYGGQHIFASSSQSAAHIHESKYVQVLVLWTMPYSTCPL